LGSSHSEISSCLFVSKPFLSEKEKETKKMKSRTSQVMKEYVPDHQESFFFFPKGKRKGKIGFLVLLIEGHWILSFFSFSLTKETVNVQAIKREKEI